MAACSSCACGGACTGKRVVDAVHRISERLQALAADVKGAVAFDEQGNGPIPVGAQIDAIAVDVAALDDELWKATL